MKYRKLFWLTVVLVAMTSSTLAFVSTRTKKATSRIEVKDSTTTVQTDEPQISEAATEGMQPDSSDQVIAPAGSEAAALPEVQADEDRVEVETVTVRPRGFEPREIVRPQGPFILAINNRSGATELALHLDSVQRTRLHEERLPRGRVTWNKVFDLPPGDYLLSEENHPDWICRFKLTDK